jgi:hypothetical protein
MTLSDLASIGSLVSGAAVLASLVYLSQQTRQNAKHTKALIQQGRAAITQSGILQWIPTNPSLAELYLRGLGGDTTLDRTKILQFLYLMNSVFFTWEDLFYQHREGLVESDRHAAMARTIGFLFQSPGVRVSWTMMRPNYGEVFQTFIDGVMREGATAASPAPDLFEAWKALAAAEPARTGA